MVLLLISLEKSTGGREPGFGVKPALNPASAFISRPGFLYLSLNFPICETGLASFTSLEVFRACAWKAYSIVPHTQKVIDVITIISAITIIIIMIMLLLLHKCSQNMCEMRGLFSVVCTDPRPMPQEPQEEHLSTHIHTHLWVFVTLSLH